MAEIDDQDVRTVYAMLPETPPDAMIAMVSALAMMVSDITSGDCKDCVCSTCQTLRGAVAGLSDPDIARSVFALGGE